MTAGPGGVISFAAAADQARHLRLMAPTRPSLQPGTGVTLEAVSRADSVVGGVVLGWFIPLESLAAAHFSFLDPLIYSCLVCPRLACPKSCILPLSFDLPTPELSFLGLSSSDKGTLALVEFAQFFQLCRV